jgi:hypothetical protein
MKDNVKTAVDTHRGHDKLSDLYGKTYAKVKCSELLGCSLTGSQILGMNDKQFSYINQSGVKETVPYSKVENTTNAMTIHEGTRYLVYSDTDQDVIKSCSKKTLQDAKTCSNPSIWVLDSVKNNYMKAKEKGMKNKLSKTLVTSFAEIQIDLYQLSGHNNDNGIGYSRKKINSEGNFEYLHGKEKLKAEFDSATGTLHVTGTYDSDAYDKTGKVYKYNLSGKTIKQKEFTNNAVFDNDHNLASHLSNTFEFAQGSSMYCPILDGKCFVDKDTINQMLGQAGSATSVQ